MIVALVLLSAFLHAAWNALLKREEDKDRTLIAAVAVAAVLAAAVALTRTLVTGDWPFPNLPSIGWSLVAGLFEQVYFVTLALALDRGPLGRVYTISRGGAVVLVYPLSVFFFAEPLSALGTAGSAAVVAGLVASGWQDERAVSMPLSATAWAALCACAIASYHLAYKAALTASGAPSAVFAASLLLSTVVSLVRTGKAGREVTLAFIRESPAKVTLMGFLCGGSFLILIQALAASGAGFVLTLRNTSVLFALLLAWSIGERPAVAPAIGAGLVAAGAALMAM
jgi:drug/metabolite transporter (DMT)-like permease